MPAFSRERQQQQDRMLPRQQARKPARERNHFTVGRTALVSCNALVGGASTGPKRTLEDGVDVVFDGDKGDMQLGVRRAAALDLDATLAARASG
jgi:hypothetical protein